MLLDNGAFHKAERLVIPEITVLLFIPSYAPELNPTEKIWWKMKRAFTGKLHKTLENVSEFISNQVEKITKKDIKSTTHYEYIFLCDFRTNIY
jgi:transposase